MCAEVTQSSNTLRVLQYNPFLTETCQQKCKKQTPRYILGLVNTLYLNVTSHQWIAFLVQGTMFHLTANCPNIDNKAV